MLLRAAVIAALVAVPLASHPHVPALSTLTVKGYPARGVVKSLKTPYFDGKVTCKSLLLAPKGSSAVFARVLGKTGAGDAVYADETLVDAKSGKAGKAEYAAYLKSARACNAYRADGVKTTLRIGNGPAVKGDSSQVIVQADSDGNYYREGLLLQGRFLVVINGYEGSDRYPGLSATEVSTLLTGAAKALRGLR